MIPSIPKAVILLNIRIHWFDVFDVIIRYKMANLPQSMRDDERNFYHFRFSNFLSQVDK